VVALQLYDQRERELPDLGLITLFDPESQAYRLVDTGRAEVREQFGQRAEAFDRALQRDIRESGGDLVRLETGRPYAEPLIAFFRNRERAQRH
jgi:hypothetical protein